jgi:ferrochelatase
MRPIVSSSTPDAPLGVLVTNLGSPDAPTAPALRRFLAEFLWDRRVIEMPRPLWWLILHCFVLRFRPRQSAKLYQRIWTPEGSPQIVIAQGQAEALRLKLAVRLERPVEVVAGMRYGQPSIRTGLEALRDRGCNRFLVLPLFPQYFAGTGGSTFDAVADVFEGWRRVPDVRFVADYHDDPGYIAALAESVRDAWRGGEPDRLVLSFHGIPVRYGAAGDPYEEQCRRTASLLVEALDLPDDKWVLTFQSRFGKEEWIRPYTDKVLADLGREGVSVDVICPGFSADCLETLEEIEIRNREAYVDAGGDTARYRYIAALNDRPSHLTALADLVERQLGGWL